MGVDKTARHMHRWCDCCMERDKCEENKPPLYGCTKFVCRHCWKKED